MRFCPVFTVKSSTSIALFLVLDPSRTCCLTSFHFGYNVHLFLNTECLFLLRLIHCNKKESETRNYNDSLLVPSAVISQRNNYY